MSPRQSAVLARERAVFYAAACERPLHEAWRHISASRRLIHVGISGGAGDDPLAEKIRAALLAGVLPGIDERLWAGKAQGDRVCACCTLQIPAGEVEYEPQSAPRLYAHLRCFIAWRRESARLEYEGRREPGVPAAGA